MEIEKSIKTKIMEKLILLPFISLLPLILSTAIIGLMTQNQTTCCYMLISIAVNMTILLALFIASSITDNRIFCDALGWHKAPRSQGFDGCSLNGTCPACGKEVMQDSQGNWF